MVAVVVVVVIIMLLVALGVGVVVVNAEVGVCRVYPCVRGRFVAMLGTAVGIVGAGVAAVVVAVVAVAVVVGVGVRVSGVAVVAVAVEVGVCGVCSCARTRFIADGSFFLSQGRCPLSRNLHRRKEQRPHLIVG